MQNNLHRAISNHCRGDVVKPRVNSAKQVELTCACCGVKFFRNESMHRHNISRGRTKTFCSQACSGKVHRKLAVIKTESQRIKAARDGYMEQCPNCGERFLKVIDTRLTRDKYRRRRKHCQHCNHRVTTIELPENVADTYLNRQAMRCLQCDHNNKAKDQCDFHLPEYMTTDAQDCNLFGKCP